MYIMCKLVNTVWFQWYTHLMSSGCEQINEKLIMKVQQ